MTRSSLSLLNSDWKLIESAVLYAKDCWHAAPERRRRLDELYEAVHSLNALSPQPVHTDMDRNPTNFNLQAQIDAYGEAFRQECFLRRVSDNTVDQLARRVAELERVASSLKETLNNPQVRGFTPS